MQPLDPLTRRLSIVVALLCGLAVFVLSVKVHRFQSPIALDARGHRVVFSQPFGIPLVSGRVAADFQQLGNKPVFAGLVAGLVVIAVLLRDWLGAALAAVGPAVALLLTEKVGKPVVGRREGGADGFPSGHTTAMASLGAIVVLLAYRRWGVKGALYVSPVAIALPTGMVGAVVRLQAHLFTDAVAGVLVGVGVVLGLAAVVSELVAARAREAPATG